MEQFLERKLNENIAIVEGYKLALAAYKKQQSKEEQPLAGLEDLNDEKLFTVGFMQVSNICRYRDL